MIHSISTDIFGRNEWQVRCNYWIIFHENCERHDLWGLAWEAISDYWSLQAFLNHVILRDDEWATECNGQIVRHSTKSPFLPSMPRRAQFGRRISSGRGVWFIWSHIVLVILFLLLIYLFIYTLYKKRAVIQLTLWRWNYYYFFFNFSTFCILNVNNTGTKQVRIMKPTAFWREQKGEYRACLKYSVPIYVE